jgi:hypothetical protein
MLARETLAVDVLTTSTADADLADEDGAQKATVGDGHEVVVAVRRAV